MTTPQRLLIGLGALLLLLAGAPPAGADRPASGETLEGKRDMRRQLADLHDATHDLYELVAETPARPGRPTQGILFRVRELQERVETFRYQADKLYAPPEQLRKTFQPVSYAYDMLRVNIEPLRWREVIADTMDRITAGMDRLETYYTVHDFRAQAPRTMREIEELLHHAEQTYTAAREEFVGRYRGSERTRMEAGLERLADLRDAAATLNAELIKYDGELKRVEAEIHELSSAFDAAIPYVKVYGDDVNNQFLELKRHVAIVRFIEREGYDEYYPGWIMDEALERPARLGMTEL